MRLHLFRYLDAREHARLKLCRSNAKAQYGRQSKSDLGYGVGANTYRAFRGIKKPSKIFKEWASKMGSSKRFRESARSATSQQRFESLHDWLGRSLSKHWHKKSAKSLAIAHRLKLVDLFVKHAVCWDHGETRINKNFERFAHVPLDSKVFSAVDGMFSGVLLTKGRSMGQIRSIEAYSFYQDVISTLTRSLGMYPLHFDYYAGHRELGKNLMLG